ncbi:MAG: proteasome protein [Actinomycetales bacterium]|nr:MAG: proteasome protein [Actinomycetales bacterium]
MQDPTSLYRFEPGVDPAEAGAGVLVTSLGGFVDAGATQRALTEHVIEVHESTVVATFDVDQLLDYRGRRPVMVFDRDHWSAYETPALHVHRVLDRAGTPFLMLAGPEPDYQWDRMVEAVRGLIDTLGVQLTVSVHGIPMAVPHTRPLGVTPHANSTRLLGEIEPVFGQVHVPGSFAGLLELRLGDYGHDAMGYAVHVPHYLSQSEYPDASLVALDALSGATGLDFSRDALAEAAVSTRAQVAAELAENHEVQTLVAALEQQFDAFQEGRRTPSPLTSSTGPLPSADEIGADVEAFLRGVSDDG